MRGSSFIPSRRLPSSHAMRPWLLTILIAAARWMARKMAERRNRNALLELSDDQLKDIGLSRGQTESDVHVYSRY
ncbi:Uncharacterized conserved protein YjiS, DUF1127 family [Rhizobium mongolense subsp. loessense]|uniref:Uncharacterized conserved protein YjiS, DUF1127 family n=1 Tax=Rhizobium mongolense subsp. loessense TaxID=158890 RepID=A0A1G4PB83_9HYPH|nr:DUF1127 domain-containing protein [Rhizobium mongolense]SCW29514.1 Uncharacterized conserved protein YjiS, DUF1127 family [Rhizobium mongolense subsp. loessense]